MTYEPSEQSKLQMKCARQNQRLSRLEEIQRRSKKHDLARRNLDLEARIAWYARDDARRESAYMKGYKEGYMKAVLRAESGAAL